MATLRNSAVSRHRLGGHTNIAAACRHTSRHPTWATELLTQTADQLCRGPAPGVDPDRVAAQVFTGLNASVSRTVSLPRIAGLARSGRAAVVHRGRWRSW